MSTDTEEIYKEVILELYRNPLNKKALFDFDCTHKEFNPSCGDEIEIFVKFDNGKIKDIGHQGVGCAISQASVSLLTEEVKGKSKDEVLVLDENKIKNMLGIPISQNRIKCAMLGLQALHKCIQ